jgi:hypothetical protein
MKYEPKEITFEQANSDAKNNIRPEGLYYFHTPYVKGSIWCMFSKIYGITNDSSCRSRAECIRWLLNENIRVNKLLKI